MQSVFKREKGAYGQLLRLAVPILLQNLISSSAGMVDTVMVSSLGQDALAGLSLANSPFFVVMLFVFGIQSGGSVLMAQYWGKKNTLMINRVMGVSAYAAGSITFLFATLVYLAPYSVMGLTSNNPQLVAVAAQYGRVVAYSYLLNSLVMVYVSAQRCVENPHFGLAVFSTSMVLNVFLNWTLIFGKFGLPAMGIKGAALATLLSRSAELAITLVYIFFIDKRLRIRLKAFLRPGRLILGDYIKYATPVVINETLWGLGTSLFPVIYGHMEQSSDIVAAYSVSGNIDKIVGVAIFAVAHATAVIVGKKIGAGEDRRRVYETGRWLLTIAFFVGIFAGLSLAATARWGTRSFLFTWFDLSQNAQRIAVTMLYILGAGAIFKYLNTVIIVGILRGGGDVRAGMYIDIITMYLYALPVAGLTALALKADISLVYALIMVEEFIKTFIGLWRFTSRKWIRNVTRDAAA